MQTLAMADALEADGRFVEAIDALTDANRAARDPEIERRLVRLRHETFARLQAPVSVPPWPAVAAERLGAGASAVVTADEVTPEAVVGGILGHGYLHVRRFVPVPDVDRLVDGIDRAFDAFAAHAGGTPATETTPWFEPFTPTGPYNKLPIERVFAREAGGVWLADSPRLMFEFLEVAHSTGLVRLLTACFGERPAMSMRKSTLRRVPLDVGTDWHQDGAFMGEDIRTINVWLSLSHCGRDAPGLDIVPQRLPGLVQTGTEGAKFPWAVAPDVVERTCTAVARPVFEPGDIMLFDHLFLHRTACDAAMTRERYAIETWFFAPSVYPDTQIPLMV